MNLLPLCATLVFCSCLPVLRLLNGENRGKRRKDRSGMPDDPIRKCPCQAVDSAFYPEGGGGFTGCKNIHSGLQEVSGGGPSWGPPAEKTKQRLPPPGGFCV